MMSLVAAMELWDPCTEVRCVRWGGEAMQFAIVSDDAVVVVGGGGCGRGGGRHTTKIQIIKT